MTSWRPTRIIVSALALTAVVGAYNGRAAAVSPQAAATASVWDSVYTKEQAGRGLAKYAMVCSNCHQSDLTGSDQAPGLAGGDFLDRWEGQSVADLADRIRTSMPLDDIGSLTVAMSADITAYLLQANNFPAGQEELKADRSAMKTIAIKRKT